MIDEENKAKSIEIARINVYNCDLNPSLFAYEIMSFSNNS